MDKIILPYRGKTPVIDETAFIAPTAAVIGDVTIGAGSSVWFGAVVRGDFQPITIGKNTNIQENATIHVMRDAPVRIDDGVIIGHNAVVHTCRIEYADRHGLDHHGLLRDRRKRCDRRGDIPLAA